MDPQSNIIAVVGLGNPGKRYELTRHNVGFQVLDLVAGRFSITLSERKYAACWGLATIQGGKALLCKPTTYMNLSGTAVGRMIRDFRIPATQMLVVHDDLDLPCGRLKLVQRGGAGGHRGVASIIEQLGHQDFPRLKLGIGRPLHEELVEEYVLKPPYPEQSAVFREMIEHGADAVEQVVVTGLVAAMNRVNRADANPQTP
jgi:PTH1 family peptidyl-tRNA hydrolase